MNQFEVLGANTIVAFYRMLCGVFIIMIVSGLAPIGGSLAFVFQYRLHGSSLDIRRDLYSGKVEEGRGKVYVHTDCITCTAGFNGLGITDDERHALTFFIHKALVEPAMFAEEETLVGGVDNDCIVQFTNLFKIIQQTADVFVYG